MLWACLIVGELPRPHALDVFRNVATFVRGLPEEKRGPGITHTALAHFDKDVIGGLLGAICPEPSMRELLRPLLLLHGLPARKVWQDFLQTEPDSSDWDVLKKAVALTLDHQSQAATDCRWARVICMIAADRMRFFADLKETATELIKYPAYGDMAKVRPSVRATEIGMTLPEQISRKWANAFWKQCLEDTYCAPAAVESQRSSFSVGTTTDRLYQAREDLRGHFHTTLQTSAVDPKHDSTFGLAFYSLAVLQDLLQVSVGSSIVGRIALRALIESYITLGYLKAKDAPDLWTAYRNYGAGQTKLAFLKIDQASPPPGFIDSATLKLLANEDVWLEFQDINLGHWANTNLRKMSEEAGLKGEYDKFYDWTSGFVHGQWGCVRNAVFTTCLNPLHRLHRIPRSEAAVLPDVVPDAVYLGDKILEFVDEIYPQFRVRLRVD